MAGRVLEPAPCWVSTGVAHSAPREVPRAVAGAGTGRVLSRRAHVAGPGFCPSVGLPGPTLPSGPGGLPQTLIPHGPFPWRDAVAGLAPWVWERRARDLLTSPVSQDGRAGTCTGRVSPPDKPSLQIWKLRLRQ